jgi:hypothetical protein
MPTIRTGDLNALESRLRISYLQQTSDSNKVAAEQAQNEVQKVKQETTAQVQEIQRRRQLEESRQTLPPPPPQQAVSTTTGSSSGSNQNPALIFGIAALVAIAFVMYKKRSAGAGVAEVITPEL